ncbi:unnamed protein product [Dicrocoelium dendriticum]|nr:unnamed protein product [Dicrocoelium dendriticum]
MFKAHAMSDVPDYDANDNICTVKIICLGDSAVGKSKLLERFLIQDYHPQQLSTHALTLYKYETQLDGRKISVDFWDTAGQERFQSMHAAYYHQAHACIFVFDVTRKITYKNLQKWYDELRQNRPDIPCLCVANKIDADMSVVSKSFKFGSKNKMGFYFVSASDGTNVVRAFQDAIRAAVAYKETSTDIMDQIMEELAIPSRLVR